MSGKDKGKNGQIISTRADGVVVTQSYSGGILHGETSYTFPNSSTVAKIERYNGGRLEEETWQYTSGIPVRKDTRHDDGHLTRTTWYETGTPRSQESFLGKSLLSGNYYGQTNELESQVTEGYGQRTRWDGYGQLVSKEEIQNGYIVNSTEYHPTGTPKAIIPFENGQIHGTKRTFLPGGEPATTEEWACGQQHGVTTTFLNGLKASEAIYVQGEKHGVEQLFRDGNELVEEIAWNHNAKHGPTKNHLGDETQVSWFHQGRHVSQNTYEDLNANQYIR